MNKSAFWTDITSYRQGDSERNPRVLQCCLTSNICFKVHKHICWDEEWLLSCKYLGIENRELETFDMNEAKQKAVVVMTQKLKEMQAEINSALSGLCNNQSAIQK